MLKREASFFIYLGVIVLFITIFIVYKGINHESVIFLNHNK